MKKYIWSICLALITLMASCKLKNAPDRLTLKTTPELAAPLVELDLKLRDVVNSQSKIPELSERADNVYVITYKDTVFSETIAKYVNLEDQTFDDSYTLPASDIVKVNTPASLPLEIKQTFTRTETFVVSKEDQRFTKVDMKSGMITLEFDSDFPYSMEFNITFPDFRKGTEPLTIPVSIPAGDQNQERTIDLSGYKLDLTDNNSTQNKFRYLVTYTLKKPAGQGPLITASNNHIAVKGSIKNLKYSYLEGYLGEIPIDPPINSYIQVELFKNSINSKLSFTEPEIKIGFDNSSGISANVVIDPLSIKFANRNNDSVITRNNSPNFLDTTLGAALTSDTGRMVTTNVVWNAQNSNIAFAFEPSPFNIYYKAKIVLNKKKAGMPTELNFITDKSLVRVRAEVQLPIIGTLHYLTIADTVDMRLSNPLKSIDFDFDSATFKLNTENGFPLDCKLQAYFLDSTKIIQDSLILDFNKALLPAAVVGADGKIISKSTEYYQRSFSKADFERNIKNSKYLLVKGDLNSFKSGGLPQSIKIYSENSLRVKLSGEVKAKFNVSTDDK